MVFLALLTGCTPPAPQEINWRAFEANRAMKHVRYLVELGPRPAGSTALAQSATYIKAQLEEIGLHVDEQAFISSSPRGPVQFRNVIAKPFKSSAKSKDVIIVASHYDTKWMPNINFVGANDGGSSSGVLLEIARCAGSQPNIWYAFFDGEEAMRDYTDTDGLVGSKFFVQQLKADNMIGAIRAVIVLDMIGDARLNITVAGNSTPHLADAAFAAARDVGHRDFFSLGKTDLVDDHQPFLKVGIPAVNLIDFEFGSAPGQNDYWHTPEDTLDKLSLRSLEVAGQTTLRLLTRLRVGATPAKP